MHYFYGFLNAFHKQIFTLLKNMKKKYFDLFNVLSRGRFVITAASRLKLFALFSNPEVNDFPSWEAGERIPN